MPGDKSSGTLKLKPSSPPVKSDNWEASVWKAAATASVIMAKKIARTRSENKPMAKEKASVTPKDSAKPKPMALQVGPHVFDEIAMPYAPMPKNMVWAKLTMPV